MVHMVVALKRGFASFSLEAVLASYFDLDRGYDLPADDNYCEELEDDSVALAGMWGTDVLVCSAAERKLLESENGFAFSVAPVRPEEALVASLSYADRDWDHEDEDNPVWKGLGVELYAERRGVEVCTWMPELDVLDEAGQCFHLHLQYSGR